MLEENISPCDFEYEVIHEIPSAVSKIVYIPNEGPGVGRDGIMVKFSSPNEASWIGVFAFGDMLPGGECKVYPGPGRMQLTILAKGDAYIVSPNDPSSFIHVKSCPAIRAIPVPSLKLMLFHDYTQIVAYNESGLAWETKRISWDGIEIDEVSDTAVMGKSWDATNEQQVEFRVDLANGSHQGGSSPPDY